MNGGKITQKNGLDKEARQGDPISAYLSILVIRIGFFKNSKKQNKQRPKYV